MKIMRIMKGVMSDFVFTLLAIPFVLWLILKALATSSPTVSSLLYFLAIAYGLYSIFTGVMARHDQKGSLWLGIYVAGAFLIPFLALMSFRLSGIEYTLFPYIPGLPFQVSKESTSVGILAFYYITLEGIFAFVWCPFRKYTVASCTSCEMTKICKGCKVAKSTPCERCRIRFVGLACLVAFMGLVLFEVSLMNG